MAQLQNSIPWHRRHGSIRSPHARMTWGLPGRHGRPRAPGGRRASTGVGRARAPPPRAQPTGGTWSSKSHKRKTHRHRMEDIMTPKRTGQFRASRLDTGAAILAAARLVDTELVKPRLAA